LILNRDM